MNKIVHQIWIGSPLPEREAAWVEGVRAAAVAAGWEHRLWGREELQAAYGHEPVAALFARLMVDFPMPTTYTLMGDYYRLRVLADGGGVYLDTDFSVQGGWPEWPAGAGVLYTHEFFTARPTNCFFYCAAPAAMRRAAELAAAHLLSKLPPGAADLPTRYVQLVRRDRRGGGLAWAGVGPIFLCRRLIPEWEAAGVPHGCIDRGLVAQRQWGVAGAALTHHGAASWHEGGRAAGDPFWAAEARRALRLSAAQVARQLGTAAPAERPAHARPVGGLASLPAPPEHKPTLRPGAPRVASAAQFELPRGVRRVVVLSNVTHGFSVDMVPLAEGDLVIHCNHARHREAAMAVPGTRHWLFVRHGHGRDPRGWHWYHDGSFDGFERVFFVHDATDVRPFAWWGQYKEQGGSSPTTGFIAANNMRELYPELPLILAGFDPTANRGTPRWDGHNWQLEAAWYTERGFTLLRPAAGKARILVLICSCCAFVDRQIRHRDAAACYRQRRACRINWLRGLTPANVEARFIVGEGPPIREPLVVQLPGVPDDYAHLPLKMQAAFRYAVENHDFDWLFKCDDDTFCHLGRLAEYIESLPPLSRDVYGAPFTYRGHQLDCACGGGGYILHRRSVEAIAAAPPLPAPYAEDRAVGEFIRAHGGRVHMEPRFNQAARPTPARDNDIITAHRLRPEQMFRIRQELFLT